MKYGNLVSQAGLEFTTEEIQAIEQFVKKQINSVFWSSRLEEETEVVKSDKGIKNVLKITFRAPYVQDLRSRANNSVVRFEGIQFSVYKEQPMYFDSPNSYSKFEQGIPGETELPEVSWSIQIRALGEMKEYRRRTWETITWPDYRPYVFGTELEDLNIEEQLKNISLLINRIW